MHPLCPLWAMPPFMKITMLSLPCGLVTCMRAAQWAAITSAIEHRHCLWNESLIHSRQRIGLTMSIENGAVGPVPENANERE